MDLTDEEIAKKVQLGDKESFNLLVNRYEIKLKRYGRKFLSDQRDIEEIIQEVFIKAYTNIQSFNALKKFSPWIYRIAHNEFVNKIKKKKKNPLLYFDLDTFIPYFISKETSDKMMEKKEIQEIINKSLDKLDFKYREPLILYYFENLSYKDISEIMHIPVSTVGIRIKRGKDLVKYLYKKHEREIY
jgi:RNA polymerase sigma-70 factor (ECF subfamily)